MNAVREPSVAGLFYPADRDELMQFLRFSFSHVKQVERRNAIALVSPHAGYIYSGFTAAHAFASLEDVNAYACVVVIGPNHTGLGADVAVSFSDWRTPLGIMKNKIDISSALDDKGVAKQDELAHMREHSVEVQLPFLQFLGYQKGIVPICMLDQSKEVAVQLANTLHNICPPNTLVVASSDFSHYIPHTEAVNEDLHAVDLIVDMDVEVFDEQRRLQGWTICGYGPIMCAMEFAKLRGATKGEKLFYDTSASVTKDYEQVVGYCAIRF